MSAYVPWRMTMARSIAAFCASSWAMSALIVSSPRRDLAIPRSTLTVLRRVVSGVGVATAAVGAGLWWALPVPPGCR